MSATSSSATAPDALELAALLCSRVCHDLISPVGAIVNGLEVLDDNPKPEDREFALDLIRKSAKTASARLQFCRLAFGAADRPARRSISATRRIWRGVISKTARSPSPGICRACCCRRTGSSFVEYAGHCAADHPARRYADDRSGRRRRDDELSRHGRRPQRPPAAKYRRSPEREFDASVDAHAVQPYYTRLLAQACGLIVTLAPDGEKVIIAAS